MFFPPAAVLAVPSCFFPLFSLLCFFLVFVGLPVFFRILRLRLLFPFAAPPVLFHAAGSSLAVPLLSGSCFPCFLLVFFRLIFTVCSVLLPSPSGCSPSVSVPPSACCGVMHSGFGSFSAIFCLAMMLSLLFLCFLTRSNLWFPSRRGLPFGPSQIGFGLCFLRLVLPSLLSVCLRPVPLSCSLLRCSVCLFLPVGSFSLVLCLVRCCFLPGHFLFLLVRVAFALFGSSLLSFRGSCLRSLRPFSSRFLCCSLHLLPSIGGSLSPFLGSSSSLLPCFRLRLLRSVACPVLGLHSMAGSCPFSFSVCLPSAVRCFLVAFLPSGSLPSRTLFPLPCVFPFHPSGFSASLCFRSFLLGSSSALLSALSSRLFHHWAFVFLARSRFLVPPLLVFSLLFLISAFISALLQVVFFLVSCLCPSGSYPLGGVLCCFFCGAFSLFPVFQGFRASPASSLLLVLFLGSFLVWLPVSLRSLRSGIFLLFRFCWGFLVFFCSSLFCLLSSLSAGFCRFVVFLRVLPFSLYYLQLLLVLLLLLSSLPFP